MHIAILISICKASAFASHIVGGEFELIHSGDNNYRLNLIIYFDEIWGNPGAKYEPTPVAWIFRKRDDAPVMQVTLPFFKEELVQYTIPACTDYSKVKTTKQIFSSLITMDPANFDDPEGYYIVWQRCCRNYEIKNIISDNPDAGGIGAGQTFYLEIPPLIKNGERFINSSPELFPPLSDYACVGRGFYADFKGHDADGDSLVYSLAEPLNTPTPTPHPQPPSTAPYPTVLWEDSYSLQNIVHGDPDLTISDEGLLRVTPTEEGIFVFAVKCEEYRDGQKIGEVRRDFQMVVVSCPAPGNKPEVEIRLADGSTYQEGNLLEFAAEDDKCVQFSVKDPKGGDVSIKLDPVGYEEEHFSINVLSRSASGDELNAEVCFTDCPPSRDLPFEINFIGLDDTCPQPLQDTVRLSAAITPPDNDLPVFKHKEDAELNFSSATERTVAVNETSGGFKLIELRGEDANGDMMDFTVEPLGFSLAEYGMAIVDKENKAGVREAWLEWNYDCQQISFDERTSFEMLIYLEDQDYCEYLDPVLLKLNLEVILPANSAPVIYSEELNAEEYYRLESPLQQVISFDIKGTDTDGDSAVITADAANFSFSEFDIDYRGGTGEGKRLSPQGPTQINTIFTWPLTCRNFVLAEQDSFRVYFMIEDYDKCEISNKDTLTIDFIFTEPTNTEPELDVASLNDKTISNDTLEVTVGEAISLSLTGSDQEGDQINLSLLEDNEQYEFTDAEGNGMVKSIFSWTPDCIALSGQPEAYVPLTFVVQDEHCIQPALTTTTVFVHIKDRQSKSEEFLPPNFFSPNGDQWNPYFGMYKKNPTTGEEENILPIDNCAGSFEKIVIFNRWGREVFSAKNRDFKWYGEDAASGVYYYHIIFTNKEYKGSLTLQY